MYWASVHSHEHEAGAEPLELWQTVGNFHWREGETHTDPFYPFDHPLALWHAYSPSNREPYFGQVLAFNDCVMRTRYTHDYAMLFDVDEFLYINATTFGRASTVPLAEFFRETFPHQAASLEFVSWGYPRNCPAQTVGNFFDRHKYRYCLAPLAALSLSAYTSMSGYEGCAGGPPFLSMMSHGVAGRRRRCC
jgi:hypothetical protein